MSKPSAYLAAVQVVEKLKGLTEEENQTYLKTTFDKVWSEHDIHQENKIDVTEAY